MNQAIRFAYHALWDIILSTQQLVSAFNVMITVLNVTHPQANALSVVRDIFSMELRVVSLAITVLAIV